MNRSLHSIVCAALIVSAAHAQTTKPHTFEATLPSGVRVEFLGVLPIHDTEKGQWQSPDGSEPVTMPYRKPIVHFTGQQPSAHLAFELKGLSDDAMKPLPGRPAREPGRVIVFPELPSFSGYPWTETIDGKRRMFFILDPFRGPFDPLRLIVAAGSWKDLADVKPQDTGVELKIVSDDSEVSSSVSLSEVTDKDGKATAVFQDADPDKRYVLHATSLDSEGHEHGASAYTFGFPRIAGKPRQFSYTFDVPKAKIASLKVKWQPYETVDISNIAMTADDRTEPQMTPSSPHHAQ